MLVLNWLFKQRNVIFWVSLIGFGVSNKHIGFGVFLWLMKKQRKSKENMKFGVSDLDGL